MHALRIARSSALVMVFTFVCTLLISLEDGLIYGILASLVVLLYQLSDVRTHACSFATLLCSSHAASVLK